MSARDPRNIGKLLQVIERESSTSYVWKVDGWYHGCSDDPNDRWAHDSQLQPLRDKPGKDETLQWQPIPTKEKVTQ